MEKNKRRNLEMATEHFQLGSDHIRGRYSDAQAKMQHLEKLHRTERMYIPCHTLPHPSRTKEGQAEDTWSHQHGGEDFGTTNLSPSHSPMFPRQF